MRRQLPHQLQGAFAGPGEVADDADQVIVTGHGQAMLQDLVELVFALGVRVGGIECLVLLGDAAAQRFDPFATAKRGDAVDALIVEDQSTDAVAGVEHHPRRQCAEFGGDGGFEAALRAEKHRHALVDDDQRRAVPFFGKGAHHRFAGA
ncbi:hypothetical protein D3C79_921660 [compost metagenome]